MFVPPLVTGTGDVRLAGFKKYALSRASNVPASITPSLINTSPLASVLTLNCVCKNLLVPSVENELPASLSTLEIPMFTGSPKNSPATLDPVSVIGLSVVASFLSVCTTTAYALSPLKNESEFATPLAPNLLGDTVPEIIFSASIFVTASVFQFAFKLLEVFTTALTCVLLAITSALPTPITVISFAFVTRSFILLNASDLKSCNVNEFVVTDPIKNLLPLGTTTPSIVGNTLVVLPSDKDSILIASPVVKPCARVRTLLSVIFTTDLVTL